VVISAEGDIGKLGIHDNNPIIWLGPVIDEASMLSAIAVSPAANRWQSGLIQAIQEMGVKVNVISYLPEPVWPRGRLRIKFSDVYFPEGIRGEQMKYWNLPLWRNYNLGIGYKRAIRRIIDNSRASTGLIITYNGPPANVAAATYARKRYGIPWVCIGADGEVPPGADGYIFLSWDYYKHFASEAPKLHLDGGVSEIKFSTGEFDSGGISGQRQIVMFTGSLYPFAGASFLARAFYLIKNPQVELWICGKGVNSEVERLAALDPRIKLIGFVPEQELQQLMKQADIFVNPRPSKLPQNEKNFPSKIFEYLAYGKPIISTWTLGLSPEYHDTMIILEEETEENLATNINMVLNWDYERQQEQSRRVAQFLENHSWIKQAKRLFLWLMQEKLVLPVYSKESL